MSPLASLALIGVMGVGAYMAAVIADAVTEFISPRRKEQP